MSFVVTATTAPKTPSPPWLEEEQVAAITGENAERRVVEFVVAVDAFEIEDAGVERE